MEEFKDLDSFRRNYLTVDDLLTHLDECGFSVKAATVKRWEKIGIIPVAKRVKFQGTLWRVYNKDRSDFSMIVSLLEKRVKKRIKIS